MLIIKKLLNISNGKAATIDIKKLSLIIENSGNNLLESFIRECEKILVNLKKQ